MERRRTVVGVVVRPHRHHERPRGKNRQRADEAPGYAHERPHGRGVAQRGPVGAMALFLRLPRRRLGDRKDSVRSRRRAASRLVTCADSTHTAAGVLASEVADHGK